MPATSSLGLKHVHDVDVILDVGERIVRGPTEHVVGMWIHRNDLVALILEVLRDLVGVLSRRRRTADDGDRLRPEDLS